VVAIEQHTTYTREVRAGESVYVRSRVLEVRDKVMRIRHDMFDAETHAAVATTELTAVFLDLATRRAVPMPEDVRARVQSFVS